jgi:hypothetical protein
VIDSIVWVSSPDCPDFYDAELRAQHEHLRTAYGISPGNEVLDIGCGAGLTTREAARAAEPGRVVGVDISERMLERARQATAAERLGNVVYQVGDAQTHQFAPGAFDVVISRFGTMFFADPAAASRTSPQPCDPARDWCCSSGSEARTTSGRRRSMARSVTRRSHPRRCGPVLTRRCRSHRAPSRARRFRRPALRGCSRASLLRSRHR